jgi:CheY-like chemotaxis protein
MMAHSRPILIVEDDPDIREVLQLILEGEAYTVLTAKNGLEGLNLVQSLKNEELPFLILLDLQMPILSGQEFLKLIRAHARPELVQLSIVVLSAGKIELENLVVQDRLAKPVDVDRLLQVVRSYEDSAK